MVIMLGPRQAKLVEFQQIRLMKRDRGRSAMALYRRDTRLKTMTNAAVRRALESVGSGLPACESPDYGRWLQSPKQRQVVLDLWDVADPGRPRRRRAEVPSAPPR